MKFFLLEKIKKNYLRRLEKWNKPSGTLTTTTTGLLKMVFSSLLHSSSRLPFTLYHGQHPLWISSLCQQSPHFPRSNQALSCILWTWEMTFTRVTTHHSWKNEDTHSCFPTLVHILLVLKQSDVGKHETVYSRNEFVEVKEIIHIYIRISCGFSILLCCGLCVEQNSRLPIRFWLMV